VGAAYTYAERENVKRKRHNVDWFIGEHIFLYFISLFFSREAALLAKEKNRLTKRQHISNHHTEEHIYNKGSAGQQR